MEDKTSSFVILLLILLIVFFIFSKGLYTFNYNVDQSLLDSIMTSITSWDLDYKWFFKSSNNENTFLSKNLGDNILTDTYNI
jgi:hypothetical protein